MSIDSAMSRLELSAMQHPHVHPSWGASELESVMHTLKAENAATASQMVALKSALDTAKRRNAASTGEAQEKIESLEFELKVANEKVVQHAASAQALTIENQTLGLMNTQVTTQVLELEDSLASTQKQADLLASGNDAVHQMNKTVTTRVRELENEVIDAVANSSTHVRELETKLAASNHALEASRKQTDLLASGSSAVHQSQLASLQSELRAKELLVEQLKLRSMTSMASINASPPTPNDVALLDQILQRSEVTVAALELRVSELEAEQQQMKIEHARSMMAAFTELKESKEAQGVYDASPQVLASWMRDVEAAEATLSPSQDNANVVSPGSPPDQAGLHLRDILHTSQGSLVLQGLMKRALSPGRATDYVQPSHYCGRPAVASSHTGFESADHYANRLSELKQSHGRFAPNHGRYGPRGGSSRQF